MMSFFDKGRNKLYLQNHLKGCFGGFFRKKNGYFGESFTPQGMATKEPTYKTDSK